MTNVSDKYVHLNLGGAGLQYIPHYGIWTTRCIHCFSLSHQSSDCELAPSTVAGHNVLTRYQGPQRCFQWNETQSVTCPYPNCKFQHVCYICSYEPKAADISHKAVYCPKRRALGTSQEVQGPSSSKGYKPKPLMSSWS